MKRFTLTLFYEGNVYNANTYVELVDIYSFVSLYRSLCRANNIPLKGPEVVYFDFEFVDDNIFDTSEVVDSEVENVVLSST